MVKQKILDSLQVPAQSSGIKIGSNQNTLVFSKGEKTFTMLCPENSFVEYCVTHAPIKLISIVKSKLGLNQRVFARNCICKKISKESSNDFVNEYHLMGATGSAFNYGLFYKEQLLAVASFSKGRKMNRIATGKLSYELVRFCCKDGISISGGLMKLVLNFCREKQAGDVMTYVDKQLSDGEAFKRAGFIFHSEKPPVSLCVGKETFSFRAVSERAVHCALDEDLVTNAGSMKFVYTPGQNEKL